jgi:predicted DNA-binding transcriptional regulator AlpA
VPPPNDRLERIVARKPRWSIWRPPHSEMQEPLSRDPVSGIDQVLSTRDVERITGRHRCTIYRWVCAGTFPGKRGGGGKGWLRSDVERWLIAGGSGDPL